MRSVSNYNNNTGAGVGDGRETVSGGVRVIFSWVGSRERGRVGESTGGGSVDYVPRSFYFGNRTHSPGFIPCRKILLLCSLVLGESYYGNWPCSCLEIFTDESFIACVSVGMLVVYMIPGP